MINSLKVLTVAWLYGLSSTNFVYAGSLLQIRDTTRYMERLQDAAALGDLGSLDLLQKIMLQLERDILVSSTDQLSEPRNVNAVALFLLSGGNPNAVAKAYRNIKIENEEYQTLLDVSLAYARSEKEQTQLAMGKLNLDTLPANVAGRLYIAKATLISNTDPTAAINSLETASVLMRGTMVDEASLRRCVSFAAKANDIKNFERCSENYMRRFPKSIYWKDFSSNLAITSASIDETKYVFYQSWLKPTLDELPIQIQLDIMLAIAKQAVPIGNFVLANKCAIRAVQLADNKEPEKNRGLLYAGASMLGLNEALLAASKLKLVNTKTLVDDDIDLYRKAMSVLGQINAAPPTADGSAKSQPQSSADPQSKDFDDLIARANLSLKNVDAELMRSSQ